MPSEIVCAPGRWQLTTLAVNSKQVHVRYLWNAAVADHHRGGTSRAAIAHGVPVVLKPF